MGAPNGRRGRAVKMGPGRGRHPGDSLEDQPPRIMNPAAAKGKARGDKAADEHPMTRRLKRRQMRHLRNKVRKNAMGPEMGKVMASKHPGKHRVGKVRSM
jgi:hypothetical protein